MDTLLDVKMDITKRIHDLGKDRIMSPKAKAARIAELNRLLKRIDQPVSMPNLPKEVDDYSNFLRNT